MFKALDKWIGRIANWAGLAALFGGGAILTALFSWAASTWGAIASQGWGAIVFAGAGATCLLGLVLTGSLALYRVFRPLPPAPAEAASPAALESKRAVAPTPTKNADTRLMEAALAFATGKTGKAPLEIQNAIQIRDDSNGKGPYISYWDPAAGPWPSVGAVDGFTAHQVHMLPNVYPTYKTQAAKEELGAALQELSTVINKQVLVAADKANALRGGIPHQSDMTVFQGHWARVAGESNDLLGVVLRTLEYFDQEVLLKEYPLYKDEIAGTVSRQDGQPYFLKLRDALQEFEAYSRLMVEIGNSDRSLRLTELASPMYGHIYNNLSRAAGDLREWSADCNRRIGMMLRAL